ncbi:hypothetical protein AO286_19155 [Pseudomonas syringae]|uniref:hypothetical protein n=1 Tax=Pseudomonas syringae group TaxID=136849 RepID=UPI000C08D805|nr:MULTISPECIES: hypothetical protein [Pseudomonas syringae group]PHN54801.1 hypothetical protein AO286_19155 [Pseudomonas syringae]RMR16370.1 hypothetical protein ALP89_03408 [Pseudomonas syringae pv. persicae]
MNEEQIERFREIVQGIATDESITFEEAFNGVVGLLVEYASCMPKGKKGQACGSSQAGSSHPDHVAD